MNHKFHIIIIRIADAKSKTKQGKKARVARTWIKLNPWWDYIKNMIAPAVENDKVVSQNLKTELPPDAELHFGTVRGTSQHHFS